MKKFSLTKSTVLMLVVSMLLGIMPIPAEAAVYDINDGPIVITDAGPHTITGSSNVNGIVVSAACSITLDNVAIIAEKPFVVDGNFAVTINLVGVNVLEATDGAGIQAHQNTLTINGPGSLTVTAGGGNHAGIGGIGGESNYVNGSGSSNITINGGNITAKGSGNGAGIGGGGGGSAELAFSGIGGTAGNITINDGTVIAEGGAGYGAGIGGGGGYLLYQGGGGSAANGGNVRIMGGTVEAEASGTGGAGIGGGGGGGVGGAGTGCGGGGMFSITIADGAEVRAEGAGQGAGIGGGGGLGGQPGRININNSVLEIGENAVVEAYGSGNGAGIGGAGSAVGGSGNSRGPITVKAGAQVKAYAGTTGNGAGIGGGGSGGGNPGGRGSGDTSVWGAIYIYGNVEAVGSGSGAGIGGGGSATGNGGVGGEINIIGGKLDVTGGAGGVAVGGGARTNNASIAPAKSDSIVVAPAEIVNITGGSGTDISESNRVLYMGNSNSVNINGMTGTSFVPVVLYTDHDDAGIEIKGDFSGYSGVFEDLNDVPLGATGAVDGLPTLSGNPINVALRYFYAYAALPDVEFEGEMVPQIWVPEGDVWFMAKGGGKYYNAVSSDMTGDLVERVFVERTLTPGTTVYDISEKSLLPSDFTGSNYMITGRSSVNNITLPANYQGSISLDGVSIQGGSPITFDTGTNTAKVTFVLSGVNMLYATSGAALYVPEGAEVTIVESSGSPGSLTATAAGTTSIRNVDVRPEIETSFTSSNIAAAIGGRNEGTLTAKSAFGTIIIESGTINAVAHGQFAAAIGGGSSSMAAAGKGSIILKGGNINVSHPNYYGVGVGAYDIPINTLHILPQAKLTTNGVVGDTATVLGKADSMLYLNDAPQKIGLVTAGEYTEKLLIHTSDDASGVSVLGGETPIGVTGAAGGNAAIAKIMSDNGIGKNNALLMNYYTAGLHLSDVGITAPGYGAIDDEYAVGAYVIELNAGGSGNNAKPVPNITAVTISAPSNLKQTSDNLEPVRFSVNIAASDNYNTAAIRWYVNGVRQTETGTEFTYMPPAWGDYEVRAEAFGVHSTAHTVEVTRCFVMPDPYNTGYTSDFDELEFLYEKYSSADGVNFNGNGTCTITAPGVYEGFKINGSVLVRADNVILRNFYVESGSIHNTNANMTLEDGEIAFTRGDAIFCGATGSTSSTLRRLHIHHISDDAMKVEENVLVEGCYIHELGYMSPHSHADGAQCVGTASGSKNVIFRGNRFDTPSMWPYHQATSNIILSGMMKGLRTENNIHNGAGYTLYLSGQNIAANANFIGQGYAFWPIYPSIAQGDVVWKDNVWINSAMVGSVFAKDQSGEAGKRIDSLEAYAGQSVTIAVNVANYTTDNQSGELKIELYRDGALEDTLASKPFNVLRYTPYSEYFTAEHTVTVTPITDLSPWNTIPGVPPLPEAASSYDGFTFLLPQYKPTFYINELQEAEITLPTNLNGCQLRVYVTDGGERILRQERYELGEARETQILNIIPHTNSVTVDLIRPNQNSAVLIVAVYSDTKLLEIKQEPITHSGEITVNGIALPETGTIKAMIWDGTDTMQPLCAALVVDF